MEKIKKSYAKYFIGIVIILALIVIYVFTRSFYKADPSNSQSKSQVKNFTYHIDKNTPDSIASIITDILENLSDKEDFKFKETSDISKADIKVRAEFPYQSKENNRNIINLYQIWAITKSWQTLGDSNPIEIAFCSDKIDCKKYKDTLEHEFGLQFNLEKDPGNPDSLHLETIAELNATRMTLPINNISLFDKKSWSEEKYPLILSVSIEIADENLYKKIESAILADTLIQKEYSTELPSEEAFVTIAKTGTSVIGGPGWYYCERVHGIGHAISQVKDFLLDADLSVVSNESPFVEGCTQGSGTMAFCGRPSYMQNLLDTNTSIISLTGNHMADYGRTAFLNTLNIYTENDILYFGAGENMSQAWEPLIVETNAGKIAFIGFNKMGPSGVLATENLTGVAYYDSELLEESIKKAKESADIIWIDTHLWPEYGTIPTVEQVSISYESIDLGGDIVTGVSSHEIQAATIYNDKPIFYGLSNFWFDQLLSENTRLGFALKVHIFKGQIRDIEVYPTRMQDACQVRLLEGEQKNQILRYIRDISSF